MHISPCSINSTPSKSACKNVSTLITPLFLLILFSASAINTKFLGLWDFGRLWCFLRIGLFWWINHDKHITIPPSPKQSDFFMMSTLCCQLCCTLLYWCIHTKFKKENMIVDLVSMNIYPLCGKNFYANQRTHYKRKNIFIEIVTIFKKNSQWACSISTSLLTDLWNYCSQSAQYFHALPHDIVHISMKFEYKLYKLCGLLGVNN